MSEKKKSLWKTGKFTRWVRRNEPFFRVVEMSLLVVAIGLSVWNTVGSIQFGSNVEMHLTRLDSLFAGVENRIAALPKSIAKFDSSISGMSAIVKQQQERTQASIGDLRVGVDNFAGSLVSYQKHLSMIVEASDKQLVLLKESQKRWEEEIAKRPVVELYVERVEALGNSRYRVRPALSNKGNQRAEYVDVILRVPKEMKFSSPGWVVYDSITTIQQWSFHYPTGISFGSETGRMIIAHPPRIDFEIEIPSSITTQRLSLEYSIYHNRGSADGKLVIEY